MLQTGNTMGYVRCAQLSYAAYRDPSEIKRAFERGQGDIEIVKGVEGAISLPLFICDCVSDAQAYFVQYETECVLAVRGTDSFIDCIMNMHAGFHHFEEAGTFSRVHGGMLRQFRGLETAFAEIVDEFMDEHEDAVLTCTGHSSGAAIAALAAYGAALRYPGRVKYVGFGSPKVCNQAFRDRFFNVVRSAVVVCNGADPIAKLFPGDNCVHACRTCHIGKTDPLPDIAVLCDMDDHHIGSYVAAIEDVLPEPPLKRPCLAAAVEFCRRCLSGGTPQL